MEIGQIEAEALQRLIVSDAMYACVDMRERGEFALEHIPGTTPLARGTLEYRVQSMVPSKRIPVVVCCDDGRRSHLAAQTLIEMGYSCVRILAGGLHAWKASGLVTEEGWGTRGKEYGERVAVTREVPQITAEELLSRLNEKGEDVIVIDVRAEDEYLRGHVPGAYHIPGGQLLLEIGSLPVGPESTLVISCAGRTRGILGAEWLRRAGVRGVYALKNGAMGWRLAGYELEEGGGKGRPLGKSPHAIDWAREATRRLIDEERIRGITVEEFASLRGSGEPSYAVDVRLPGEFRKGHVPGSILLPAGQIALAHENFIAVRKAPIIVLADDDIRPFWAAAQFLHLGFPNVFVLEGGLGRWAAEGHPLEEADPRPEIHGLGSAAQKVSGIKPAQLRELLELNARCVVLDVRGSGEFGFGHIPGARWLARGKLELEATRFIPDKTTCVVTVCDSGVRSTLAAATLKSLGYVNARFLDGGLAAWQRQDFDVVDGLEGAQVTREEAQADFGHSLWKGTLGRSRADMEHYLSWEEGLGRKYLHRGSYYAHPQ